MNSLEPDMSGLMDALERLRVPDHPCFIYKTPAELFAVLVPFIRIGLMRNERCLYIVHDNEPEVILKGLEKGGIDTSVELARGALVVCASVAFYPMNEPYDSDRIRGLLEQAVTGARSAGFASLRLVNEMKWIFDRIPVMERLIEHVVELNEFYAANTIEFLRLYNLTRLAPEILLDVIRTHPKIIFNGMVCTNYSYRPKEDFSQSGRPDYELEHLLCGMLGFEKIFNELQAKKALLNAVVDNTSDAIYVKDLQGRYLMINPAGAAFLGKQVEEVLGRTDSEIMVHDDEEKFISPDQQAMACGKTITVEESIEIRSVPRTFHSTKGAYCDVKGNLLGIFGIARDITERKQAEERISAYQGQLRMLASELILTVEGERRQIATTLHDQVGQSLALASIKLGALRQMDVSGGQSGLIDEIRDLVNSAIRSSRTLTFEISPPVLYELGLEAALASLAEHFRKEHGILVDYNDDTEPKLLSENVAIHLYQSVRELIVNALKHANPRRISITSRRNGCDMEIRVEDNGTGFDVCEDSFPKNAGYGFGLFSIRERISHLGGSMEIESVPGHGTTVTLTAPLMTQAEI